MTFKIKKVTGECIVIYYPMVKKSFWGVWHYISLFIGEITLSKKENNLNGALSESYANKVIDQYKSQNGLPTTIATKM